MKWFIVYMAYQACSTGGMVFYPDLSGCQSGNQQRQMMMPSREICEQVVKDNPNQGLQCWAKPIEPEAK